MILLLIMLGLLVGLWAVCELTAPPVPPVEPLPTETAVPATPTATPEATGTAVPTATSTEAATPEATATSEATPTEGATLPPRPEATATPTATGLPETYTVQRGDYLILISERFYGQAAGWYCLWRWNVERVENPNLIFAGQVLGGVRPCAP